MGIQGLLVAVKPVIQTSHVSQFRGKRVAVDGYCWLHKAVYGCCVELAQGRDTNKAWISYCMQYINMLLHHQIHIVMVFDGDALPAKLATEVERRKGRAENLRKAKDYEARGDHSNARNYYARAVDVTPKMAAELIAFLRQHCPQVECIVAPYEADAQLAYLTQIGYVDIIISEDSDNIPYGSKEVMFKLDRDGSCQYLDVNMLFTEDIDKFDLRNFSMEMMITMCILSGCDYLVSSKVLYITP